MSSRPEPDPITSKVEHQLAELKQMEKARLLGMPAYSEVNFTVSDRSHWLGIWREDRHDGSVLIVAQCRNPEKQSTCARGFYLDADGGSAYSPAREEDLRPYL